jgi:transposase
MSTPPGCNASTRSCSTREYRNWARASPRRRGGYDCRPGKACHRPAGRPSRWRCESWTPCRPSWTRLHRQIRLFASRQPGCTALQAQYGVGPITSTVIWAMMGDTRRFSASRQAVRHTGLDVTVYSSDGKRSRGHLAKQGPPLLRWALYEAACMASHTRAPDHDFYAGVKDHIDHKRATISVARKIARRSHHILRELGDKAYAAA